MKNEFLTGYLAALLWTGTDEHYNNMVDAKAAGYTVHFSVLAKGWAFVPSGEDGEDQNHQFEFESEAWDAAYKASGGGSCNDTNLDNYFDVDDIKGATLEKCIADCAKFEADNAALLADFCANITTFDSTPRQRAGHEFALSRNGHGSGFFDCDTDGVSEETCEALQEICRAMPNVDLYVGDDGELYI